MWCIPVITSGAYRKPKMIEPITANLPVSNTWNICPTKSPKILPTGPIIAWAKNTVITRDIRGTITILIDSCTTLLSLVSIYPRVSPAKIAGITWAW